MIGLIQRVTSASVSIDGAMVGEIDRGILALIGVERGDGIQQADRLLTRILGYRIFEDEDGKMNQSLSQISGGLLLVPQFTLPADTQKGTRPSFSRCADPDTGRDCFEYLCKTAQTQYSHVACGRFQTDMQVQLINDGPVTFWLQVKGDNS